MTPEKFLRNTDEVPQYEDSGTERQTNGRQWERKGYKEVKVLGEIRNLKHNELKCKCLVGGWYLNNIDSKGIKIMHKIIWNLGFLSK